MELTFKKSNPKRTWELQFPTPFTHPLTYQTSPRKQISESPGGGGFSNRKGVQVDNPQKTPVFDTSQYRKDPPFLR